MTIDEIITIDFDDGVTEKEIENAKEHVIGEFFIEFGKYRVTYVTKW